MIKNYRLIKCPFYINCPEERQIKCSINLDDITTLRVTSKSPHKYFKIYCADAYENCFVYKMAEYEILNNCITH